MRKTLLKPFLGRQLLAQTLRYNPSSRGTQSLNLKPNLWNLMFTDHYFSLARLHLGWPPGSCVFVLV
jgi:hypothetical protein